MLGFNYSNVNQYTQARNLTPWTLSTWFLKWFRFLNSSASPLHVGGCTTSASRCLLVVAGLRECWDILHPGYWRGGEADSGMRSYDVTLSHARTGSEIRDPIRYLASIVAIARHRAGVAKTNVLPRLEINPRLEQPTELMCRRLRWRL